MKDEPVTDPPAGQLVRAHRERLNMSQEQLAAAVGTTPSEISRLERGRRVPRLDFLSKVVRSMELQLTLGVAPLWDKVDAEIEAASQRSIDEIFAEAKSNRYFDGFDLLLVEDSLEGIEHWYCGLTAAALLGAPVRVQDCELMIPNEPDALDRFDLWLNQRDSFRWDARLLEWGFAYVDPRKPGPLRWRTDLGVISLVTVESRPRTAVVTFQGTELPVVGLADLDTADPQSKRILERVRMRLASSA
jgi:transcriptional regulator with XRE-family HTH domain